MLAFKEKESTYNTDYAGMNEIHLLSKSQMLSLLSFFTVESLSKLKKPFRCSDFVGVQPSLAN